MVLSRASVMDCILPERNLHKKISEVLCVATSFHACGGWIQKRECFLFPLSTYQFLRWLKKRSISGKLERVKIRSSNEKHSFSENLNQKLNNASYFKSISSECVRFLFKFFTTHQILIWKLYFANHVRNKFVHSKKSSFLSFYYVEFS